DYERIYGRVRDARVNRALTERGMKIRWFEPIAGMSDLLPYPHYRDFWYDQMAQPLIPTPATIRVPDHIPSEPIPTLAAVGHIADGKPIPPASIHDARRLLQDFLAQKVSRYHWQLSYPAAAATTGLSPHIKFGVISIRECVQTANQLANHPDVRIQRGVQQLIARLRWGSGFGQRFRYLPQLEICSLYQIFDDEGWPFDADLYQAWQQGQTGFPIVDAAARCLQATGGWLDLNFRSRAIYASFLGNLLGMDWRFGALHFMRHLIDGDCPIDHYQWAMQCGVTHCLDKKWTRIYNPEQVAIDRCDPDGAFIKRWVPELADVPPERLGKPGAVNGYPTPILDYKTARQRRVAQLERQRAPLLHQENCLPLLSRLPASVVPFAADRIPSDTRWAQSLSPELFPPPLDLDSLTLEEVNALRTWFVAHVDIKPRRLPSRSSSRRSRKSQSDCNYQQLSLFS
ncbi:MAG: deoxyribodipyrimidine photo-lyase, partial [Cyanobacteria bacterium]|nr:deoxyribodipyrimidine photo-lyase [Cyanobacteriota bacterium]MDW8203156.1 FAD-binding domain-containing protein [Cyanobacteriota bacterium SKYGB_h_bin112]